MDATTSDDPTSIRRGWDPDPARSMSLAADAYTDPRWFDFKRHAVFTQGRIVHDEGGSGRSEHAVHHFHSLVLDAYENS